VPPWLLYLLLSLLAAPAAWAADGDDDDSAGDEHDGDDDDPWHDDDSAHGVAEAVEIHAHRDEDHDTHARQTIEGAQLERTRGQDLAEAAAQVPGVVAARGSGDSTKPIIRGQQERRLLVIYDGVRHESQKWGADHATEIDPFSAGKISVIKGPAGVRYGPDAIGGVVLVEPPKLRTEPGVGGSIQFVGVSQGWRGVGAARIDVAPAAAPGLTLRVEGNYARGAALRTPDYVLGNTASEVWNAGATVHYRRGGLHLDVSYRHYDFRAGVCFCVKNSTPDDFEEQIAAGTPNGADLWRQSFNINRAYQDVTHDTVASHLHAFLGRAGALHVTYAFQHNDRQEFEQTRRAIQRSQFRFLLRTHSAVVEYHHPAASLPRGGLTGSVGVSGTFQENVYRGVPLVPSHRAVTVGVHAWERLTLPRLELEVGGRYDHHGRHSFLSEGAFDRHEARGLLDEDDCEPGDETTRCGRSFDGGSASVGVLLHAVPDLLEIKLDLSGATRFPNGDELYMNGSAPTWPVYALGDPTLGTETTWGGSPTLGLRLSWLEAQVSAHVSVINGYIQFAPELGDDGQPRFDVTIRGTFPRFRYSAINALFYGIDGGLTIAPGAPVSLVVQGAVVRADNLETGRPLLFIPADRVEARLQGRPPALGALSDLLIEVQAEYVARVRHADERADLAPAPPATFLLGAAVGGTIALPGDQSLSVGLEGRNLTRARYREYTSLLRYYADEPGLEVRLRVRFDFGHHLPRRNPPDA